MHRFMVQVFQIQRYVAAPYYALANNTDKLTTQHQMKTFELL
jgi:hypothetical protein